MWKKVSIPASAFAWSDCGKLREISVIKCETSSWVSKREIVDFKALLASRPPYAVPPSSEGYLKLKHEYFAVFSLKGSLTKKRKWFAWKRKEDQSGCSGRVSSNELTLHMSIFPLCKHVLCEFAFLRNLDVCLLQMHFSFCLFSTSLTCFQVTSQKWKPEVGNIG